MISRLILGMFPLLLFWAAQPVAAVSATSSCLECHADESIMKSLYVPPPMGGGEGEG